MGLTVTLVLLAEKLSSIHMAVGVPMVVEHFLERTQPRSTDPPPTLHVGSPSLSSPLAFAIESSSSCPTPLASPTLFPSMLIHTAPIRDLANQTWSSSRSLRRPVLKKTAAYGHFGRNDPDFTWETPK